MKERWNTFKDTLTENSTKNDGIKGCNMNPTKRTKWWNEHVKAGIKNKNMYRKISGDQFGRRSEET